VGVSLPRPVAKPRPVRGRRRVCERCRAPISQPPTGRPRKYCSGACRKAATIARQRRAGTPQHRDQWFTPEPLRTHIREQWNLTLDVCAGPENALAARWIGPQNPDPRLRNALDPTLDWAELAGPGGVAYCCPPFTPVTTVLEPFLEKCHRTAREGGVTTVGLIPAQITNLWWVRHVEQAGAWVCPVPGRVGFAGPHARGRVPRFGVALVEWSARPRA
jgi:DNA N-6-adenine-methyltransferase (Dam)